MNYNKLIIAGNLTADPVVRETQKGNQVVNMRLASNGFKDEVVYMDVESWDEKIIELAEQYLKKGFPVLFDGTLRYNEKMERLVLRVGSGGLTFVGTGKRDEEKGGGKPKSSRKPRKQEAVTAAGGDEDDDDIPF